MGQVKIKKEFVWINIIFSKIGFWASRWKKWKQRLWWQCFPPPLQQNVYTYFLSKLILQQSIKLIFLNKRCQKNTTISTFVFIPCKKYRFLKIFLLANINNKIYCIKTIYKQKQIKKSIPTKAYIPYLYKHNPPQSKI